MRTVLQLLVAILFLGVLGVCGYFAYLLWPRLSPTAPPGPPGLEAYAPVIQSVLTPVTSLITVLFSYLIIDRQFRLNAEIEKVKLDLGERFKRESDAYLQLWKAVASAYRTIAALETRKLNSAENDRLASCLSEAEPYSFVLSHEDEARFYDYFQKLDNLRASAIKAPGNKERQELWTKNAKEIGALHGEIRDRYKSAYLGHNAGPN